MDITDFWRLHMRQRILQRLQNSEENLGPEERVPDLGRNMVIQTRGFMELQAQAQKHKLLKNETCKRHFEDT